MEPVTVTCASACTVTHVIDLGVSPWNLDPEAGANIAVAIAAVWCVAWAFRMLIRALNVDSESTSTSESEK